MITIPVIMYHSVGLQASDWCDRFLSIPKELFEIQVQLLCKKKFKSITIKEWYRYYTGEKAVLKNIIVLTFDDGYLDNWVYVYPILKKYGFKATIFISPEFVDPRLSRRPNLEDVWSGRCNESDLTSGGGLSFYELEEMERSGLIDIQSHTMTHTWYFKSEKIIDFHHPGDSYYWLEWNADPKAKYRCLGKNIASGQVPFGMPIYEYERAIVVRRFFEEPRLAKEVVNYVNENGQLAFFEKRNWRDCLFNITEKLKQEKNFKGRYETEKEYKERLFYEIAESKKILEEKLNKKIEFLCWPGGIYTEEALRISREAGYIASTISSKGQQEADKLEIMPRIKRIAVGGYYGQNSKFMYKLCARRFLYRVKYVLGRKLYALLVKLCSLLIRIYTLWRKSVQFLKRARIRFW